MSDKKDSNEILIENSKVWSDDLWFLDQKNRKFKVQQGDNYCPFSNYIFFSIVSPTEFLIVP